MVEGESRTLAYNEWCILNQRLTPLGHRALLKCMAVLYDIYIKMDWNRLRRDECFVKAPFFYFCNAYWHELRSRSIGRCCFFVFGSLFSSSCQQCKIKLSVRSIEIQLYWNYRPIIRTHTVSSIAQTIF